MCIFEGAIIVKIKVVRVIDFESGFKALVLQWMENLSDRALERFLREKTPDHT